jgi:PKD repeat protein
MNKKMNGFSLRIGFFIFISILLTGYFCHSSLSTQEPLKYSILNSIEANLSRWWEIPGVFDAPLIPGDNAGNRRWIQTETLKSQKQEVVQPRLKAQEPYPIFLEVNNQNPLVGDVVIFKGNSKLGIRDVLYQFVYGDGQKTDWQSEPETNHTYRKPGKYDAILTVKVGRRILQSEKVPITVRAIQLALKRATDNPLYVGMPVKFQVASNSSMKGFVFQFHFGDNSAPKWLEERTVEHVYSAEGTYEVFAYASRGIPEVRYARRAEQPLVKSQPIRISVKRPQKQYLVSLEPDRNRIKVGEIVRFRAYFTPFNQEVEYKFSFGDRQESDWMREPEIGHLYRNSGEFLAFVRVRMRDKDLAASPKVGIIVEDMEHKVYLRIGNRNPFVSEDVMFEGGIEPGADNVRYRFDFGDKKQSEWLSNPVAAHFYGRAGRYRAVFTAEIGGRRFTSNQIQIEVRPIEIRLRLFSDPQHYAGRPVRFEASTEPDMPDLQFQFHFGDGSNSEWNEDKTIEHAYTNSGVFEAYVTARKGEEFMARSPVEDIEIFAPDYQVILMVDNEAVLLGDGIRFNGAVRPTPEKVLYQFDYGDEEKSGWLTEPISTHIYNEPGIYSVILTARIGEDIFHSNQVNVRVRTVAFKPRIEALPARIRPGKGVIFRAVIEPSQEAIEYMFIFGDGEQSGWSAETETVHAYSEEGTYPAYVKARWAQEYESMSDLILIEVSHIRGWMLWSAIGLGALIIFGGGAFVSSRIAKAKATRRAEEFNIRARPKKDPGIQDVKIEKAEQSNLGLRIRPVRDTGSQEIKADGSLIVQKEENHA